MDLIERARETLQRIANASLATASPDGLPWNSPIFVAWSPSLAIYWSSHRDSVHSRNIATRPDVFLVLFDSTAPDESGRGVYVRATAHELREEAAIQDALDCLALRRQEKPKHAADFVGTPLRRVYQAVPATMWTNVVKMEEGHYFDERVVIDPHSLGPMGHFAG